MVNGKGERGNMGVAPALHAGSKKGDQYPRSPLYATHRTGCSEIPDKDLVLSSILRSSTERL